MTEDENHEAQDAVRTKIEAAVSELARLRNPDRSDTTVVGWALAYEWTDIELEQANQFATGTTAPLTQAGSMTRGLFEYGVDQWTASRDGGDES